MSAPRVPSVVYVLAGVIFTLGTSEFMLAGLLEDISASLHVSLSAAGLLVTGFAVGMIVGAPGMAMATRRLPVRATLLGSTAVFAAAHVLGALAPDYGWLLASRVIAAIACGGFWAVASVHASRVAPPAVLARSLAALVGGLTVANVVGVPAGAWLGEALGWRATFWALAVVTSLAFVLLLVFVKPARAVPTREPAGAGAGSAGAAAANVPAANAPAVPTLRDEVSVLRLPRLWLALATTAAFQAAIFASFSYFGPLLTQVAGLPASAVPGVLAAFGIGAFVGVTLGGRWADRNLFANLVGSLSALTASLILLALLAGHPAGAVVGIVLVGVSGFSVAGAMNARVFQIAFKAPTFAAGINTSAFNVGNAAGPALGAAALALGWPVTSTVWIGASVGALSVLLALAQLGAQRRAEARDAAAPVLSGPVPAATDAAEPANAVEH